MAFVAPYISKSANELQKTTDQSPAGAPPILYSSFNFVRFLKFHTLRKLLYASEASSPFFKILFSILYSTSIFLLRLNVDWLDGNQAAMISLSCTCWLVLQVWMVLQVWIGAVPVGWGCCDLGCIGVVKSRPKVLSGRVSGATRIWFFGFYSVFAKTKQYGIRTLGADGQSIVR